MTDIDDAIDLFADAGVLCARVGALPEAVAELADRLEAEPTHPVVLHEVRGLADRLARAGVNGTPRPVPVKPFKPPPGRPSSPPQPKRDDPPKPPPPPPAKPKDGQ